LGERRGGARSRNGTKLMRRKKQKKRRPLIRKTFRDGEGRNRKFGGSAKKSVRFDHQAGCNPSKTRTGKPNLVRTQGRERKGPIKKKTDQGEIFSITSIRQDN